MSKSKQANLALLHTMRSIFKMSRESYGSPRVHDALIDAGHKVGLNRVARIMRENGLRVRQKSRYRCRTTCADPKNPVMSNILDRDFTAARMNEKWVTDVTFVPTDEGWLYLAAVLDLYNREVVGWAMGDSNNTDLTVRALDMALESNNPPVGLVHHSDRGSNYTSGEYQEALSVREMTVSMSRRGNCWDNAVAESFFATLKKDLIHRYKFETRRQAASAIFEYIEVFYNRIRKHSRLGYTSPIQYKHNNPLAAVAA